MVPGGNFGDHLIWRGAEKLAAECGLEFESLSAEAFERAEPDHDAAVYLHGHGGFVPWWCGTCARLLEHACRTHRGPLVQGPCTIHDDSDYADQALRPVEAAKCSSVILLAREQRSYEVLCGPLGSDLVGIEHDTALALTAIDFPAIAAAARLRRDYDLHAIREDKERCGGRSGTSLDPALVAKSFDHWLAIHACARSIRTNRLHSAIAGVVFGVPTTLMASSYHKPRSVWEHSLRELGVGWDQGPFADRSAVGRVADVAAGISPRFRKSLIKRHLLRIQPHQLGLPAKA